LDQRDRKGSGAKEPADQGTHPGDKEKPPQGIDAATVAAYEKLGAVYGGWEKNETGTIWFQPGREHAEKGLPGFRFAIFPQARLPEVAIPFGLDLSRSDVTDAGLKELAGLRNLARLMLVRTPVTDAGLKELRRLNNLTALNLSQTKVTDAGVKELASLKNLATLDVTFTPVTARGLRDLGSNGTLAVTLSNYTLVTDAKLRVLRELDLLHVLTDAKGKDGADPKCGNEVIALSLAKSPVTDDGLQELAGLKNLATLDLNGTKVTDRGLTELASFNNLTMLDLRHTKVTAAGVAQLRKALPRCVIHR
jgi:hypothetical protein